MFHPPLRRPLVALAWANTSVRIFVYAPAALRSSQSFLSCVYRAPAVARVGAGKSAELRQSDMGGRIQGRRLRTRVSRDGRKGHAVQCNGSVDGGALKFLVGSRPCVQCRAPDARLLRVPFSLAPVSPLYEYPSRVASPTANLRYRVPSISAPVAFRP